MKHPEDQLQEACIKWFRMQYPKHLIIHIPNGGYRDVREAAKFKRLGVLAGVSDLFIIAKSGKYSGLFVELKAGNNKLTDKQSEFITYVTKQGFKCHVIYNIDDFIDVVSEYMLNAKI